MIARPLSDDDARHIIANMRAADAREAEDVAFDPSRAAIAESFVAGRGRELAAWCFAGSQGGAPIAMISLWLVLPRVAQCQMVATDDWGWIAPSATRFAHRVILPWLDAAGMNRAFCLVRQDHAVARRWLDRLGFACEGAHPGVGDAGMTYLTYARLHPAFRASQSCASEVSLAAAMIL